MGALSRLDTDIHEGRTVRLLLLLTIRGLTGSVQFHFTVDRRLADSHSMGWDGMGWDTMRSEGACSSSG